jgi:hypothetical protein
VTKPKPRERPVWGSFMTITSRTAPNEENAARRLSSVVFQERLPDKVEG